MATPVRIPRILCKDVSVVMTMTDDAFNDLPEVTNEDRQTGMERFRILLGTFQYTDSNTIHIHVSGSVQMLDTPWLYIEQEHAVTYYPYHIERQIELLRNEYPEYAHLEIVGNLHTHPYSYERLRREPDLVPWQPSPNDLHTMISHYEDGFMQNYHLIFGIGGGQSDGTTGYVFSRLVCDRNGYDYERIKWLRNS